MSDRRARALLALAFFFVGVAAGWRQDPKTRPFTFDNQIYFYMAERAAAGVAPHVSLVDHKHQLSTILSGLAIRAGRKLGIQDVIAVRAMSIAVAGLTVAAVTWLAAELTGSLAGAALAGLAMLVFPGYFTQAAMGVRPKVFMATFMSLALVAFARRRPAASGFLAACSFLCWQPALLVSVGLAAATLVSARERARSLARLVAGAVFAVAFYEAYFLWHGALGEQIRQSYLLPASVSGYRYPALGESLAFVVRMGIGWRLDSSRVLPVLLLVLLAVLPAVALTRPRRAFVFLRERPAWCAAGCVAYPAVAFTLLTHEGYPDMFFIEPFIALAAAVAITFTARALARHTHRSAYYGLIAACAVWLALLQDSRATAFKNEGTRLEDQYELAKQLDVLFDAYGSVWAVGCPHLLALLGRENFSPYGLLIDRKVQAYMRRGSESAGGPFEDGRLPGAILSARGGLRTVLPSLPRQYERIENLSFTRAGIQVWVQRLPRVGGLPRPAVRR